MKQNYFTTVKIRGVFNNNLGESWSSNLCSVKVVYHPKRNRIGILKVYRQKSKGTDIYVKPRFKDNFKQILLDKARWNYETFVLNENELKDKPVSGERHHLEEKCERCIELGRYCK
tara:strand:+ start:378 stop:725 length:348 start_codon:yes stop_codon:yes gene_type:complete